VYLMTGDDTLRAVPQPRPVALPPAERTVGQLVGETVRFYEGRFWGAIAVGVSPAVIASVTAHVPRWVALVLVPTVFAAMLSASFVAAAVLVLDRRPPNSRLVVAWLMGWLVVAPAPFLALLFILPGVAWLAAFGLVIPVLIAEDIAPRASLARAWQLARADFVHAFGTLLTLGVLVFLTQAVLAFVLRGFGGVGVSIAFFLASVVVSPLLFVGTALLYGDQAARVK
jgi:hypothetical protein